ncbi:hypothetical protein HY490_05545, partial [Candidatus Woesearchaeota archaeon]|nr:hypothetical protein [Candidatus Woesearchaeota archaeon]
MSPIVTVLICLVAMYVISETLRLFKIPRVISYILAGILLSLPPIAPLLFLPETLSVIGFLSDIGT